jgi:hypothetical protein
MNTLLPTTLDEFIRWLMGQTRTTPPPAFTTAAGTWRVYPAHEVLRGPQEPWRVVIPAVPPEDAAHFGQFHLPPGPALQYAAILFYLLPVGEDHIEIHAVCVQPALAAYYATLLAQIAARWPADRPVPPPPAPPPPPIPQLRSRRLFADAAAVRLAVTAVLRAYWVTTRDRGAPPTLAEVAACFGRDEETLARWLTRYHLTWATLVREAGWSAE